VLERPVLDLSLPKLLVLGFLALIIFGPDQLPRIAAQAGRALRDLRRMADNARNDLRDGLGPEFGDFDINDLHPRNFVRKHLLEDLADGSEPGGVATDGVATDGVATGSVPNGSVATGSVATGSALGDSAVSAPTLAPGERPPYDSEAT
jgi:sec-independent protein translocase protein TatB